MANLSCQVFLYLMDSYQLYWPSCHISEVSYYLIIKTCYLVSHVRSDPLYFVLHILGYYVPLVLQYAFWSHRVCCSIESCVGFCIGIMSNTQIKWRKPSSLSYGFFHEHALYLPNLELIVLDNI